MVFTNISSQFKPFWNPALPPVTVCRLDINLLFGFNQVLQKDIRPSMAAWKTEAWAGLESALQTAIDPLINFPPPAVQVARDSPRVSLFGPAPGLAIKMPWEMFQVPFWNQDSQDSDRPLIYHSGSPKRRREGRLAWLSLSKLLLGPGKHDLFFFF